MKHFASTTVFVTFALFGATSMAQAKAAFFAKTEAVQRAEIIVIVDVLDVQSNEVKGAGWTYSEVATAERIELLKGELPPRMKLHGGENFICAQVRFKPGKHLVFLNHDGKLLTGFNWHLGTLPITGDSVEWFEDDRSIKLKSAKMETVRAEIREIIRTDWPVLVHTSSPSRDLPKLLFAMWRDGTVIRKAASGEIQFGKLPHSGSWKIWETLRKSGFFITEREHYVVPDADYETIMVHQGSEGKIHSWHGVLKRGFGGDIETDAEYRQFVEMWKETEAAMGNAELIEPKPIGNVARNGFVRGYNVAKPNETEWFNPHLWREGIGTSK